MTRHSDKGKARKPRFKKKYYLSTIVLLVKHVTLIAKASRLVTTVSHASHDWLKKQCQPRKATNQPIGMSWTVLSLYAIGSRFAGFAIFEW